MGCHSERQSGDIRCTVDYHPCKHEHLVGVRLRPQTAWTRKRPYSNNNQGPTEARHAASGDCHRSPIDRATLASVTRI